MPTVPVLDTNQIAPTPIAAQPRQAADFGAAGEMVGNAVANFGRQASGAVDAADRIDEIYDDAGTKRSATQYSAAAQDALHGQNGYLAQQGIDALNTKGDAIKALSDTRDKLIGQATNPRMKRMMTDSIGVLYANDMAAINTHAVAEGVKWGVSESQGLQEQRRNAAITHADEAPLFAANVGAGLHEIDAQAQLQGTAAAMVVSQKAKWLSGLHVDVADAKAVSDPVAAKTWIDSHKEEMLPTEYGAVNNSLYKPLIHLSNAALIDAHLNTDSGALDAPTAMTPNTSGGPAGAVLPRMIPITLASESGNHDTNASGGTLTSSAGAQGKMQVMPGTNVDPGFGVKPAQDSTPEERARVGRDYLGAMMTRYNGDPAKAWAAYNWGPGHVDGALANGGDWFSALPKATRDYVQANVRMLNGNVTRPGAAPMVSANPLDQASMLKWADTVPGLSYDARDDLRQQIKARVDANDSMVSHAQSDAKDDAYSVIASLGPGKFISTDQIPRATWRGLSPEQQVTFQDQAKHNASPAVIPEHGPTAMNLKAEADEHPELFASRDLRNYEKLLNPAEYDQLWTLQRAIQKKDNDPIEATHHAVFGTIKSRAGEAGLNLKLDKTGQIADDTSRQQVGTLSDMMTNELNSVTDGKRAPRPDEIDHAFDHAIMKVNAPQPSTWFGLGGGGTSPTPRFKVPGAPVPVANAAVPRIRTMFRASGISNPSEAQIANAYLRFKDKPGYW